MEPWHLLLGVLTVVFTAMGATWALSTRLSSIEKALTSAVALLTEKIHEVDTRVVKLESRRNGRDRK